VADIDFIETANEDEALLMESELIKNPAKITMIAWKR